MKLLFLLTVIACLQASAKGYGQTLTLDLHNAPLEKALSEIKKQTGYSFIYTRAQLKNTVPVSVQARNIDIKQALDYCFVNQPLLYKIESMYVVLIDKPVNTSPAANEAIDVSGKITNEDGVVLFNVTVTASISKKITTSNEKGEFSLNGILTNDVLVVTCIGYSKTEVAVKGKSYHVVIMRQEVNELDETVIMAYGKTTKRFNTGNIGKVSNKDIAQQPVIDPLAALHGKVPGLIVTQTNGMPGSAIKIQIRGQNSLRQGSEPLIIVDGIPFAANNQPINNQLSILTTGSTSSGLSPIASINPLDIESIEVLKDADATAIYGSRGANGVVLITTKKGKIGKARVFANFYSGWSKVSKIPEMLNTKEYLQMRREAFSNDGRIPSSDPSSPQYAPDLYAWDTTRETDFSELMLGNTARSYNGQVGLSGGNENLQFFLSSGYNKDGFVFPGDMKANRISFSNNLTYSSTNKKLSLQLQTNYSNFKNNLINAYLSAFLSLPPNAPPLHTEEGKLNWQEGGYGFDNPFSYLMRKYDAETDNLIGNLQFDYKIIKGLTLRSSIGYNSMQVSEESISPIASQNPMYGPQGSLGIGKNSMKSWIAEPQVEYEAALGNGVITVLVGSTFSQNKQNALSLEASGYTSDNLLRSLNAGIISSTYNSFSDYKYTAIFGRVNYNLAQKYLLNVTARRDGSSRFGPDKRFANFGAVGAGWLFREEGFIRDMIPVLSFGKIRTSYGLTGNDQIGNYKYLDTWTIGYNNYQDNATLFPSSLFNNSYGWETNKKFEVALELGLFKDRLFLSSAYFNSRSGNQLVNFLLPLQTGFPSIIRNFPALVENSGFEFELSASSVKTKNFSWSSSINLSLPSNKLLSFPGLSSSFYRTNYIEGESLNMINLVHSLGVDPVSGVFSFEDTDKDGSIDQIKDRVLNGNSDPQFYGGFRNTFSIKKFEIDFFFDFKKQTGRNYLHSIYSNPFIPGFIGNQPVSVLERWQKPGDVAEIQKFTTIRQSDAFRARQNLRLSDAIYSDASFLRLKTISVSWQLPAIILKSVKTYNSRFFISAQNLFTISNYKGTDPEIQDYYALPALRTIAAGINLTL